MDEESRISFIKIEDLAKDTKTANIVSRVYGFSRIIDFQRKDGTPGRAVNVYLSDGTGLTRLVLWDRQATAVEEGNIKIGDIIQIVNGTVRESTFGTEFEIILGKYTSVNLVENGDYSIPTAEEINKKFSMPYIPRTEIRGLVPGIYEISGTVVQVVRGSNLFYSCSMCGSKMVKEGDVQKCLEHGDVQGEPVIVFNIILDDGTDNVRIVFFRNVAEKALETQTETFANMNDEERHTLLNERLLGKDIVVVGKVQKNEAFERTEVVARDFKNLNPSEESKRLLEIIERSNV